MVNFDRENNPNAAVLVKALRNLGYDNLSAINDILDNSLDAEATLIKVFMDSKKDSNQIIIVDNGSGMDEKVLDQALRLGSDVERDIASELGKFGMGLTTASLSLATRIEVLTKTMGADTVYKSIFDIEEVFVKNKFVKFLGEADAQDVAFFNAFLQEESGTIIRLCNCDKLTNKNTTQFMARLVKEIGRTFREFINAGREFYVNDRKVEAEDIFMLDEGGQIYSDEEYEVFYEDDKGKEQKETIRVRLGILPDFGPEGNRERRINSATQGFYIMRNNREIAAGETIGMYVRHPQYNRFRGEIHFSAPLDDLMGVNFTKKRVNLDQATHDKIYADVKHQLRAISGQLKKKAVSNESKDVSHEESERVISKKAKLLNLPKTGRDEGESQEKEKIPKDFRKKEEKPRLPRKEVRAKFIAEHGGKGGHFYEARMEGKTVVIAWNIDHPFYERFVVRTKEDKALATSVDFLVYSMATAELGIFNDENLELIENFKTMMSMNLNTLLR